MWSNKGRTPLQKRSASLRDDPPPAYPFGGPDSKQYSGGAELPTVVSPEAQDGSFSDAAPWSGQHPYRDSRQGSSGGGGQRPHSAGPHGRPGQGLPQGRMRPLSASAVRAGRRSQGDVPPLPDVTSTSSAWEDVGPRSGRHSSVTSLRPDTQKFSSGRRGVSRELLRLRGSMVQLLSELRLSETDLGRYVGGVSTAARQGDRAELLALRETVTNLQEVRRRALNVLRQINAREEHLYALRDIAESVRE
eukprot:Hpha_TRINITY_DN4764_c0_g1::TRINITY_DN4764_c0_g1_i1::g.130514::m.130514